MTSGDSTPRKYSARDIARIFGDVLPSQTKDDRPDDAAPSLIERADQCLYQAKHAGRNRVIAEDAGAEMPKALAG